MNADPMTPWAVPVISKRRDTQDTFTLALDVSGRDDGVRFEPGQFMMLYLFGVGEVPISISGDPAVPSRLVHTIRAVGGVTRPLQAVKRGDVLGVRGPFGTPWPLADAAGKDVLIVAGGIGLAPLRPLIYHLAKRRRDYGRIQIFYGARTPADILYLKQLERWRDRARMDVAVTVDRGGPDWRGQVGAVTALMGSLACDADNTIAVSCGPEIMMRFALREFFGYGIAAANMYISMERNMHCAVGFCGHCQFGPAFICKDGPVFRYDRIQAYFAVREL